MRVPRSAPPRDPAPRLWASRYPRGWLLALALLVCVPAAARARDTGRAPGRVPRQNFSFLHAESDWIRGRFAAAGEAAAERDWNTAVRTLQSVIELRGSRERAGGQSPYVRAVEGEETYEGAHIVAAHQIAAWGDDALAAYESEFGGTAREALRRAADRRDLGLLADVAARYLVSHAGRATALLIADLALEQGDRDLALEWLEALEDLEDVSAESEARLAPWREARIRRHARALAIDLEQVEPVAKALGSAAPGRSSLDLVPAALRRRPARPGAWETTGGDRTRAAVAASVGTNLRWGWSARPPFVDRTDPETGDVETTSPWHPPRAVASADHVFASDGNSLYVFAVDDGRTVAVVEYEDASGLSRDTNEDPRLQLGLLEGHTLSLVPDLALGLAGGGSMIYAAVPDGSPWQITAVPEERKTHRDDRIQAFHWDGTRLVHRWTAGGAQVAGGLDGRTRLYGAPLFYRGRIWIAAVHPEEATGDRWQIWLLSLDPQTGSVQTRTHLGTGAPVRRGRQDEVVPTSPSADRGRVVVGTSVGIVAAVSARDGRVVWAYRYDRETDPERERRNARRPSEGPRITGFCNEPPLLALDRCYIAPVDGTSVFVLADRPRGRGRTMRCQQLEREGAVVNMSIEHIAGVTSDSGALVLVGRGQDLGVPGPLVAVRDARTGSRRWEHPGPTLFALEPYGRGLVTEREVFVSTRGGIAIYDLLQGGADRGVLESGMLPPDLREEFPIPYGNLIPVPGRGIVAVSATTITFWARK